MKINSEKSLEYKFEANLKIRNNHNFLRLVLRSLKSFGMEMDI